VVITLKPDAPAHITAKATLDSLPADGASPDPVSVELEDVNHNPTDGISLQFFVRGGAVNGSVDKDSAITDLRGGANFVYTAGTQTGIATVDITASSPAPTEDELKSYRLRIMAPQVYDNYDMTEIVVLKWYKATGDAVGQGEPVAVVGTPLGNMTVYSPATGVLDRITVDQGMNVMEGREIGAVR
jgi:biotin carboxyl carrier protein